MRTFDSAIWRILIQQCRQLLFVVIRQMAAPKVHATDTLFKALYLKKSNCNKRNISPPPPEIIHAHLEMFI